MILITGANGLIGSYVVRRFLAEGEKVGIFVRKNSDLSLLSEVHDKVSFFYGDISDINALREALEKANKVVHCAAIVSFGGVDEETMFKINVDGTKNVVNACIEAGVSQLVYISSVAAIGRDPKLTTTDENALWTESPFNSAYAKSKYLAELEVWRGIEEGLCASMVNPSIVLGKGDWNRSSTVIFKNIFNGIAFYPTGSTNVVDVLDVAEAVYMLAKHNISGERYIISGHNIKYKDFFKSIAEGFEKKPPTIKMDKSLAIILYYISLPILYFFYKKRSINAETILISSSDFRYDNSKFMKRFGFSYRPLNETIERVCKELLQFNQLKK